MHPYPKINSIFKRDEKGRFVGSQIARPEFEYLWSNDWKATEKVDGTNIRVIWNGITVRFEGKTDRAQIPPFLLDSLQMMFPATKFQKNDYEEMCLYGEGFGNRIQKAGKQYLADHTSFVLFDIKIGNYWLERDNMVDIASKLDIAVVPLVYTGDLDDALSLAEKGFCSQWGDFSAEGLVLKPETQLLNRHGNRIITKVKTKDFKNGWSPCSQAPTSHLT